MAPQCHASTTTVGNLELVRSSQLATMLRMSKHSASVPMTTQKQEVSSGLLDAPN